MTEQTMNRTRTLMTAGLLTGALTLAAAPALADPTRLSGATRYETSAELAVNPYHTYTPGGAVFVASGVDYPDALSAVPAAVRKGSPVLLVNGSAVNASVDRAIRRLAPREIFIVGGLVPPTVRAELSRYGASVTHLYGQDRYATAVEVSRTLWPDTTSTVYLTDGRGYADALAGGPLAASTDSPILLTGPTLRRDVLDEVRRLRPRTVTILGGLVSREVEDELRRSGFTVERIQGRDRYATSAAIETHLSPSTPPILVSGEDFPDALAAGALAGATGTAVRLSRETGWDAVRPSDSVVSPNPGLIAGGQVASGLENGRDVFLIPHQDDEVLSLGVGITQAVSQGRDVWVVLLTDGSQSGAYRHLNAQYGLSRADFVAARDREFLAALTALGVDPRKVVMSGFGHGRIVNNQSTYASVDSLIEASFEQLGDPAGGVTFHSMSWLDAHVDHAMSGTVLRDKCAASSASDAGGCVFFQSDLYRVDVPELSLPDTPKMPVPADLNPQKITPAPGPETARLRAALDEYRYSNPQAGRYGLGWNYSVKRYFEYASSDAGMSDYVHN